jgi:hypothetical protein
MSRDCPGSLKVPSSWDGHSDAWCDSCGEALRVRNDGTLTRHPMDYNAILGEMARHVELAVNYDGNMFGSSIRTPRLTHCVCGCPAALHMNYSDCCLNWGQDGCMEYIADVEPHETVLKSPSPFSNHYPPNSRYSTPRGGFDVS